MPVIQETIKPTVHVRYGPDASQEALRQLQYGMEEEGIPWEAEAGAGDALSLAWEAAQGSRLEVGIGLDEQDLILHYSKLERAQPLFRISIRSGREQIRALGANAARLVKKLPLKALDRR